MTRTNYRVIETETNEYIDRWYGNSDSDYIKDCQTYGIPQEDYDQLVREWGQEAVNEMTEEFEPEKKLWYAVQTDSSDAWDNGSLDRAEAERMARELGPDAFLAVIDDDHGVCLEEIRQEDFAAAYLVLDDCGTEIFEDAYTSAEDAFAAAERAFNRLTGHDIKRRTALYVLETVDPDPDSEHHLEGTVLKTWIRNGKAVEEVE